MIIVNTRFGLGFDIEHNENILHFIGDDEDGAELGAFHGLIVKVPFFSIYIGDFYEVEN